MMDDSGNLIRTAHTRKMRTRWFQPFAKQINFILIRLKRWHDLFVQTSTLIFQHITHIIHRLICIKESPDWCIQTTNWSIIKVLSSLYGNCISTLPHLQATPSWASRLFFRMITNINLRLILLHNWIKEIM